MKCEAWQVFYRFPAINLINSNTGAWMLDDIKITLKLHFSAWICFDYVIIYTSIAIDIIT